MTSIFLALILNYILNVPVGLNLEFVSLVFCIMIVEVYLLVEAYDALEGCFCDKISTAMVVVVLEAIVVLLVLIVGSLFSTPIFHAKEYSKCIKIVEHEKEELVSSIPDVESLTSISLIDTESAKKLGYKELSVLTDSVQYITGEYYTICVDGRIAKIAPLNHIGFFQWIENKSIPGYVIVDPLTNEAQYVECEMRYSESAFFGDNVKRRFRKDNKSAYFSDISFQIDDEGAPYYVVTVMEALCWFGNRVPSGVGTMNAATGQISWYDLADVPEWVDLVYSGEMVSTLYNNHENYTNGFFKYLLGSNKDVTNVADDFGYIVMGNDVYIYTGVTSASYDESNLGVLLVNSRTGVFDYYPVAGADEHSAMTAAEGIVKNFGYKASFPSLITVEGEPTYMMALKDGGGLVKQYACVNYKNYTYAVVSDTREGAVAAYKQLMGMEQCEDAPYPTVTQVAFVVENGQTKTVIATSSLKVYEKPFEHSDLLIEDGFLASDDWLLDNGFEEVDAGSTPGEPTIDMGEGLACE